MSIEAATGSAAPDPDVRPDHRAFRALDGLRAAAVLMVVATHSAFWTGRYVRGPGVTLLSRLEVGVAIFFVLSGFLLARPWLIALATGTARPSVRVYAWRRLLRIMPAYLLAVVVAFVLVPGTPGPGVMDLLRHLTFTQVYEIGWLRSGLTQTWSLCIEVTFYALLPLLAAVGWRWSKRRWRPGGLLLGCAAVGAVSGAWDLLIHVNGWYLYTSASTWLPGYLDWFAAGMAMAVVQVDLSVRASSRRRWLRWAPELGRSWGVCWTMAAALFVLSATPIAGPTGINTATGGQAVTKNLLYCAIAVLCAWPLVFAPGNRAELLLAHRTPRRLGEISYSIFLLHLIVLQLVFNALGYSPFSGSALVLFGLTTVLSIAVAGLSYRFVEVPSLRLRGLIDGPRPQPLARRVLTRPE